MPQALDSEKAPAFETGLPLGADAVDAFARDGAICLRGVFGTSAVAALCEAVAWSMDHPGPHAMDFAGATAEASFFGDVFVWTRHPAYRDLVINRRMAALAGELLGAERIGFFYDHLLVKEPGSAAPTPWHQDAPYWPMSGRLCCSLWVALDPVSRRNGAVEYVRGSHLSDKSYAPASFKGDDRLVNAALEPMPDIEANRDAHDLLHWDMAPGDVTVHHCMTLHGAPGNESTARRRGLALRFIGEDVRYDERPGIPETMTGSIATLAPEMAIGDAYGGEWFPELWRRS